MKRALLGACLGGLAACSQAKSESPTGAVDASVRAPANVAAIAKRPVDSLAEPEARVLCEEDARRLDLCMRRGIAERTSADCEAVVAHCRAQADGGVTPIGCGGYDLGPPGSCTVTVESYLACVDAWNATQTCENAGKYLDTPAVCTSIVEHCPRLAPVFAQSGTPPPCDPDAGGPPRTDDDIYGFDGCRPMPTRFEILGDSIAACYAVGPADCGPLLIGQHVKETVAPGLVVESFARSGARIAELPEQARMVAPGPGHVLVWVYILGNDLALRQVSDAGVAQAWDETFAYFGDKTLFPDGATFLLNTQYSPYDQCADPIGGGFSITAAADQYLQNVNHGVFIQLAEERPDTVTIDEYPDWLGHGDNANVRGCPHCGRDNTSWMAPDRIHPNAAGYAHMVAKWAVALDRMYGAACRGD